jgi:diguanylate cyclase (GGDEF)-like protein/PAS domain S-box-containing protein
MTLPVPNLTLPAARAVNGEVGIVQGTDYRGVDVFAYIAPVPGTPWKIVSKIDAKEALATINRMFVATLLAMGILLPLSGGIVWLWWRRNQELVESEILQGRLEQQALKQRYQSLTQMANDIILLADTNGRFIEVNDRAVEIYGYSREELVKMSGANLRSPDTRPEMPRLLEDLRQQKNMTYETVHMAKDGRCFPVEVSARFIESGNEHYYHLLIRDCTERKRAESQLRMAATVFETTSESIILTDPMGTILDVNDAFVVVNGYSREEVIGKNPRLLKSGHQDSEFYAAMWQTIKSEGRWHGELWNRKKNGDVYVGIMSITSVYDELGTVLHYVGVTTDITALKQHQQEVEHLAYHDTLTQLPNRVLLSDRMQQALARAKRFEQSVAVVCLDLDGFKAVNDTLGHAAGDNLLIEVASRLVRCVRTDDTVARLGGDEFVLLLCGLNSRDDCEHTISRMLEELLLPFSLTEGKVGNISGSIGYTLFPEDAADADTLMRHADHAMYSAKQAGKNRFHRFDLSQSNRTKANWIALARIEKALKQEEFCLYIQPKVNLSTGKVVGAEALIRWLHPVRGLVPPMEFLPLIEDQDIAVDLGEWVIREGMRQMQSWSGQGLQLPLSVNIGARQLREKNFTMRLSAILKNFPDVPPWHLEIEIVESAALDDMHQISMLIDGCQTLGVNFALDDFGTGYSSLTYLKRLSVNTLKIDQSFVRDMLDDGNDLAIVRGVIGLAQAFGSHTVAEGVETWQHASSLLELGCEIAQGYAIAHPMPAAEVAEWVRNFRMPVL